MSDLDPNFSIKTDEELELSRKYSSSNKLRRRRVAEFLAFGFVGLILVFPYIWTLFSYGVGEKTEVIANLSTNAFFGFLLFVVPPFYYFIFGRTVLEGWDEHFNKGRWFNPEKEQEVVVVTVEEPQPEELSEFALINKFASSSGVIANRLFSRAGVYLFIGVLIAFSGLVFFYFGVQSIGSLNSGTDADIRDKLLGMLPKFGMLFFIEFVALFFLRQYRAAMDEFRYYEAIKRRREELYLLLKLLAKGGCTTDVYQMVKDNAFYSTAGRLGKDESTEIIETRKLQKDEVELLQSVIDAVAARAKK